MNIKYFITLYILVFFFSNVIGTELPDSIKQKMKELSPSEQVSFLIDLSWQLRERKTDKALLYAQSGMRLADSLKQYDKLGRASNNAGVILLHYQYKPKEAVPYLHTALELALKNYDSLNIAYAYNNLGDVYYLTGNAPLARIYANKSMEFSQALNDSASIAYTHINFGLGYLLEKEYKKALEHLFNAITIRKSLGDHLGRASAYQQVGRVYYEMGEYENAMRYFEEAYEKNKRIDNKKWMAFSLDGIGHIQYQRGKYDEAIEIFDKAIKLNEERNHIYGIINNKLGKALVYSKTNKLIAGEQELNEAIKFAKVLGIPTKLLDVYKTKATFYLNAEDYKAASKSFNTYQTIYDSLYSVQQFETLFEIQKSTEINQKLKSSEHALELKRIEIVSFIVIIFLLIIVVAVIFWRYHSHKILTKKLRESNDAKDKLFSIVSHDLRNPFFTLMGYIDLLKQEELTDSEFKECLMNLESTTQNTYSLLENLLNLSATRRGKIEFQPTQFEIRELTDEIIKNLAPQVRKKSITIKNDLDRELIYADKTMIEIILRNLVSNAIKYNKEGGTVTIGSKRGKQFCVSVADDGIGMDEKTKEMLFKSEFLKSIEGTAGEKGTGIGLSLCKEFIDKHNGTITVKSEVNKGTEFMFCLPVKEQV